jgi:hypothetical protein
MLDRLISLEVKSILFSNMYANILLTTVVALIFMIVMYQSPNKEWLVFSTGMLIIWERILILKINRLQSSKKI